MQYDPRATGLIDHKDLKEFVLDLIIAECELLKENPTADNVLFNLRLFVNLTYYAKYKRNMMDSLDSKALIDSNIFIKKSIEAAWNVFYSQLELPTYNK